MSMPGRPPRPGGTVEPQAGKRGDALRAAIVLGVAGLLCACASAPVPVLLALPAGVDAAQTVMPAAGPSDAQGVRVSRLVVPEYMSSHRVRYRSSPDTLAEWPDTYWAERIEVGMTREFTAALQRELPGRAVCATSCDGRAVELTLQVDLQRLDYVRSERRLRASARIQVLVGPSPSRRGSDTSLDFDLPATEDGASGQAQAMAELLRALARAAAAIVRRE